MGHNPAFPHHERVRNQLVSVVGSLGRPQNIGVIALDQLLLHLECGPGFSKLGDQGLEQRPDRVNALECLAPCEENDVRRIIGQDPF